MKRVLMGALTALILSACGGAGSLPVTQAVPLAVTPASLIVNLGTPATLMISGGVAPYAIKNDCPPNGDSATLSGAVITVTAITRYTVTCPIQISDSKDNALTVQVTLNY